MLDVLQKLVTIGATGVGIYIGLAGLSAWRRQLTGKRDIELCQSVIESFYRADHKVKELRSAFSYPEHESKDRPRAGNESPDEKRLKDTHFVPVARLHSQSAFWDEFFARKFQMRAFFGEGAVKPFDAVDKVLREFRSAALTRYQSVRGDRLELDAELSREFDRILWELKNDKTATDIAQATKEMEKICIPIVRAGSGRAPWWTSW